MTTQNLVYLEMPALSWNAKVRSAISTMIYGYEKWITEYDNYTDRNLWLKDTRDAFVNYGSIEGCHLCVAMKQGAGWFATTDCSRCPLRDPNKPIVDDCDTPCADTGAWSPIKSYAEMRDIFCHDDYTTPLNAFRVLQRRRQWLLQRLSENRIRLV